MGNDETTTSEPTPELTALLMSSNRVALQVSSTERLSRLEEALSRACEKARKKALRNMMDPERPEAGAEGHDRNFGFACLFSALRRVRAEQKRRNNDWLRPLPQALRPPKKVTLAGPGTPGAPSRQGRAVNDTAASARDGQGIASG